MEILARSLRRFDMTGIEFVLCNLGMFAGLFVFFAASKSDRSFVQSAGMAMGGALVLVCAIVAAVYLFNSVVTFDIGQINTITIASADRIDN